MKYLNIFLLNIIISFFMAFLFTSPVLAQMQNAPSPESALENTIQLAKNIETDSIRRAAVVQNGRIKPLDTFARETILFITGKYRKWGLNSVQMYLAFSSFEEAPYAPVIEVRDIELRKRLGFTTDKRYFSLADLENSQLEKWAMPLFQKQQEGGKLDESEKKLTEAYSQMAVFRQLALKQHFPGSIDFSSLKGTLSAAPDSLASKAQKYLQTLSSHEWKQARILDEELVTLSKKQEAPELFQHAFDKLGLEILFFDLRPFLWASIMSLLSGFLLLFDLTRTKMTSRAIHGLFALSVLPIIIGLTIRVYITLFAPITNMYGTMIWVAFGVCLFSWILYALYKNTIITGYMFLGAGLILLLTENIPLILSPDMDPIVAVLRSNFWLSTHVTTITISYAAFTVAMILGNVTLFRILLGQTIQGWVQDFYHYAYRMVQLGCFLLTVGIILGGIWADYSWGRFWGWDPKETWALIADLGFIVLLHARYTGWLTPVTFLACLPVSYLLVIMAWYGVNFILAAGLHSYGFSSGGATAVTIFVSVQLCILAAALIKNKMNSRLKKS